jgi:hypothetical protein
VASGFSRKDACGARILTNFSGSHILPPNRLLKKYRWQGKRQQREGKTLAFLPFALSLQAAFFSSLLKAEATQSIH